MTPQPASSPRRAVVALIALPLIAIALAACPGAVDAPGKRHSTASTEGIGRVKNADKSLTQFLAFGAGKKATNAFRFFRPPYDLNGDFRVELTFGIYDERKTAGLDGKTIFGLEIDRRSTETPLQFYGCFAQFFSVQNGLNVFVSSHNGNHGAQFFAGARRVDVIAERSGDAITFSARDADVGGTFQAIATVPMTSPNDPHNPGLGAFNIDDPGQVGFTNFRIPTNGTSGATLAPQHVALNSFYDACFAILEASYALNGAGADPGAATAQLNAAATTLDATIALVEALPAVVAQKKKKKKKKLSGPALALKELQRIRKEVAKALKKIDKKGAKASRSVIKSVTKKMVKSAVKVTDGLLTDELRETLAGGGEL